MDSLKLLIETHLKANKLEKEIRKTRGKLIKAYKNKDSSELYTLNISYTGFAAQLNKETATFNTLLNDLEKINFINNHYDNINQYSELIDNINDSSSSSISEQEQEINTFYNENENNNNSPVVTDKDTSNISFETPKNEKPELELYNNSVPVSNYTIKPESVVANENENENENKPESVDAVVGNYTLHQTQITMEPESVAVNNTNDDDIVDNDINDNNSEHYKASKISKIRSGYKYGGKGFELFTSYKNKCEPIYSSTLLFCNETCNENKNKLREFLIEYGKFNEKMIEEIIFKTRGYYERYALIKVRGKLSYIKKKIQNMKRIKGKNILHIFKRSQTMSALDWQYMNNILYVNNFDILKRNSHKKITQLFLKYGELVKDIKMGLDSNKDPYAIVHFRDLQDAEKCIQSQLVYGGKVLNVKFSKY